MSSPTSKSANDVSAAKQRKSSKTNSNAKSTSLDTRAELADLIKKKAETSVILYDTYKFFKIRNIKYISKNF